MKVDSTRAASAVGRKFPVTFWHLADVVLKYNISALVSPPLILRQTQLMLYGGGTCLKRGRKERAREQGDKPAFINWTLTITAKYCKGRAMRSRSEIASPYKLCRYRILARSYNRVTYLNVVWRTATLLAARQESSFS